MKAFLSVIILYLLFLGLPTAKAQESDHPSSGWKISVESAGVSGSYYSPSLTYWNNVSEIRNWDQKFQAFPLFGANLEIGLRNNLRVRAEGGFASGKAQQNVIPSDLGGGSQSKTINLVPLSAILLYQFNEFILIPYLGAGAGTMFITSTYDRNTETTPAASTKASATDYMLYGVGGVKFPAASNLSIGAEVRGAFGNYKELVMNTHNVYNMQHISLDGVQVLLSLNYTFGKSR